MEARTGLVIGGLAAVTASVAVVTAVAFANTMALADSPGTTVASARVTVPAAAPAAAVEDTSAPADPAPAAPPAAEVVQAPAPVTVAPSSGAGDLIADSQTGNATPATGEANAPTAPDQDFDTVLAAAKASGSWDALRSWAESHGWSSGRLDALITRLQQEWAAQKPAVDEQVSSDFGRQSVGGAIDGSGGQRDEIPSDQKHQAGSRTGADHPAHTGSHVGHGHGAGHDAKKDQSRVSPDRRD